MYHGAGSIMGWDYFAASGPRWLDIIDNTMNSGLFQQILQESVKVSVCELKLNCKWVMQQDNDSAQTKQKKYVYKSMVKAEEI